MSPRRPDAPWDTMPQKVNLSGVATTAGTERGVMDAPWRADFKLNRLKQRVIRA
jgi:hypothetical protein